MAIAEMTRARKAARPSGARGAEEYALVAEAALTRILGETGARALLFYTGVPRPETFEAKLFAILGRGAEIVLRELDRSTALDPRPGYNTC